MELNKVVPENLSPVKNKDVCIICMDESQNAAPHICNICNKDAWKACERCLSELEICPVCRTNFNPINPERIIINININNDNDIQEPNNRHIRNTRRNNQSADLFSCIYHLLKVPMASLLCMYLGKIYIYIYCKGTCDTKKHPGGEGCSCYSFANRDNYWGDFHKLGIEFMVGLVATAILVGCCVKDS